MVIIKHKGNFNKTEKFLKALQSRDFLLKKLDKYGQQGVTALSNATPVDTSQTATSWGYEVVVEQGKVELWWTNTHIDGGIPVAILIQYGHGTRNGGYVEGRDFINPALRPIFDKIADEVWREVQRL